MDQRLRPVIGRPLDYLKLSLDELRMGAAIGQYTGWMTYPSDTPDQPDFGTMRGIQTFLIELPFDNFKQHNYVGSLFQFQPNDGTNSFHPSGAKSRALLLEAFLPMAMYLIEQAAAPCCAVRVDGPRLVPERDGQPASDVGLMAATIGQSSESGAFTTWPALEPAQGGATSITPAYDSLPAGKQTLYFLVQNYGSKATDVAVNVLVEHREVAKAGAWTAGLKTTRRFSTLSPLAHRSGETPVPVSIGREYRVTIEADANGDLFPLNNRKVFRFIGRESPKQAAN